MKNLLTLLIFTVFSISQIFSSLNAQCSGSMTLTTQSQVNAFACSSFSGDLFIEDDNNGVDNIVDLTPIFNNTTTGLTSVTGDFEIVGCDNLTSLDGLQGLTDVGGNFEISFNFDLTNIDFFPQLQSIGGDFKVFNNGYTSINTFGNLSFVGNKFNLGGSSLVDVPDFSLITNLDGQVTLNGAWTTLDIFSNLISANFILGISGDNLQTISGFDNLTTVGSLIISDNPQLTDINAFNTLSSASQILYLDNPSLVSSPAYSNLTSLGTLEYANSGEITTDFANITTIDFVIIRDGIFTSINNLFPNLTDVANTLAIFDNPNLIDISGFGSISSIANLEVQSNSNLNCCNIIPLAAVTTGSIIVQSNFGNGCTNFNTILNNPPVVNCPANETQQLASGQTTISVSIMVPTVAYDCDLDAYTMTVTDENGNNIVNNMAVVEGGTELVSIPEGDNVVSFSATGNNDLTDMCSYIITVDATPCFGTITLTTQAQVDAFNCATFDGDLFIEDDGSDPITTFANSFLSGLTTVTGSLTITNNPNLTDLSALDNLVTVSGNLSIISTDAQDLNFNSLQSVGGSLFIQGNVTLPEIAGFNSLTSVGELQIWNNNACQDISGFQALTVVNGDLILNNQLTMPGITGFGSISQIVGNLEIASTPMSGGFPIFGPSYSIGGTLIISNCNLISDISNLASISSVGGNLNLTSNASLADCCIVPDVPVGGSYIISNNDSGCNSFAEIGDEAPVITCPANQSISLMPSASYGCEAVASILHPTPTDDCDDVVMTNLLITDPLGTVTSSGYVPGSTGTYFLMQAGDWFFEFSATDGFGNTGTCEMTVNVSDDMAPTWNDPSGSLTINGVCGVDNANTIAAMNIPAATDDCGTATVTQTNMTTVATCGGSEMVTFEYQTTDDSGNINPTPYTVIVNLQDTTAPTFSGIPTSTTINCGDPFPSIPVPTAMDVCAGDVTSSINQNINIITGNCTFGTFAEIHEYTWTVDDGCGNIATEDWTVTINNDYVADLGPDIELCQSNTATLGPVTGGVTYAWSTGETTATINVAVTGTYSVTVTSVNGCCSEDNILVDFNAPPDISATGGVLDCNTSGVTLTGSSTTTGVTYSWTGPNGFSSSNQNPTVFDPGFYTLTVTTSIGCTASETIEVTEDIAEPVVTLTGGTLTCSVLSVQLMSTSSISNVTYSWSGPASFSSTVANPMVSVAGTYTLTVTPLNGCFTVETIVVLDDTAIPDASTALGPVDCVAEEITLLGSSMTAGVIYSWSGPGGFSSSMQNPVVSDIGTYTLTVEGTNGCTETSSIVVVDSPIAPSASATVTTLTCSQPTVQIMTSPSANATTFTWSGPNGFTSTDEDPIVSAVGFYTLIVGAANGCTSTTQVEVLGDSNIPDALAQGGAIDCITSSITLMGSSTTAGVTYQWTGPGGFSSAMQNPVVTLAGTYTLTVLAPNGCIASGTAEVINDTVAPSASANAGMLSCSQTTTQIMTTPSANATTFTWSGPNGFTSTDEDPIVSEAGIYTLTIGGSNGCTGTTTVDVMADSAIPDISAVGGTANCTTGPITLSGSSSTPGVTYQWTGPGNFTSTMQNPVALLAGTYTLTVQATNGCIATSTAIVVNDTVVPTASPSAGVLTCSQPSVQIMTIPTGDAASFAWTGPNGFTSSDQNPTVSSSGTYTLVVTGSNGCSSSTFIEITEDFNAPTASALGGTLGCTGAGVTISGSSMTGGVSFQWNGPGGFTSNEQNPVANTAGTYTLTVIASNGCTATAIAIVDTDANVPQVSVTGGTIDCNFSSVQLMGSSTNADVTVSWTGPNNFSTVEPNPIVTEPGIYTFTVLAGNGCTASQNAQVVDDTAQPNITLSLSGADCDEGTRQILVENNDPNLTVSWTGPGGFTSSDLSPRISLQGTYIMQTFPSNGCNSTHTITMDDDVSYTADITTEDITVNNLMGSATINIEGGTGPFDIMWDNGENSFTAVGLEQGDHTVVVTDGLGCMRTFMFTIDDLTSTYDTALANEISFYPNPASEILNIDFSESQKTILRVDIFTMEGKIMKQIDVDTNVENLTISVDTWSSGVYFVKVSTSTSYISTQIFVE